MSQAKNPNKNPIKPATPVTVAATPVTKTTNTAVSSKSSLFTSHELIFGRSNYIWMGIGAGLVALGLLLMLGGAMPSPDVWDDNIIYSFRIITLAPMVILIGLIVQVYAIFKD